MTTGQLIQETRKKAGLTQKQLAEKLGLAPSSIAQWECGARNPKPATIRKIAAALSVSPGDLVPRTQKPFTEYTEPLFVLQKAARELDISLEMFIQHAIMELDNPDSPFMRILAIFDYCETTLQNAEETIKSLSSYTVQRKRARQIFLIALFNSLSDEAQAKAVTYLRDLFLVPGYRNPENVPGDNVSDLLKSIERLITERENEKN